MDMLSYFVQLTLFYSAVLKAKDFSYNEIDLPKEHLRFYFNKFKEIGKQCLEDQNCPYKDEVKKAGCWGYEPMCNEENSYSRPICTEAVKNWDINSDEQINMFYSQADFGYLLDQFKEMMVMCEPLYKHDSSLECSKYLRFCRGRNIKIDFKGLLNKTEPLRYSMDVLTSGQIGGYCTLHEQRLLDECTHISPLQSWGPELRHFRQTQKRPFESDECDIFIEKPTYLMKIDASVNMYHHFCDFLNLYMSQHLNLSEPDGFTKDIHILIWESYTYTSNFADTFKAFTNDAIKDLKAFKGKTVCFRNIVFPLLPRMIFGMYYNMPLVSGCEGSGLVAAFGKHILHRLKIPELPRRDSKIQITLLSRKTEYRNVLNEVELIASLNNNPDYFVKRVVYDRNMTFKKQLEVTRNSDIFIGMHGAGLTHLLFLPDWAVVFEMYNCEDARCYFDLARLRGVKYITWEDNTKLDQQDEGKHPDGGAHPKFTNYRFDVNEFLRLVKVAEDHVRKHRPEIEMHHHDEL